MNSTSNNAGSSGGILRGDNSKIVAKDITIAMMLFMIFSFCCGGAFGVEEMVSSGGARTDSHPSCDPSVRMGFAAGIDRS